MRPYLKGIDTKPHPELYLTALAGLRVRAEHAIAFEDARHGIEAAKEAGIYCVAVPNRLTKLCNLDRADLVLESLLAVTIAELCMGLLNRRDRLLSTVSS